MEINILPLTTTIGNFPMFYVELNGVELARGNYNYCKKFKENLELKQK